jgi:hypothetical protein
LFVVIVNHRYNVIYYKYVGIEEKSLFIKKYFGGPLLKNKKGSKVRAARTSPR